MVKERKLIPISGLELINPADQIDGIGNDGNIPDNPQKTGKNIIGTAGNNNRIPRLQERQQITIPGFDKFWTDEVLIPWQ